MPQLTQAEIKANAVSFIHEWKTETRERAMPCGLIGAKLLAKTATEMKQRFDAHSSFDEKRFFAVGEVKNRVLFVVYTVRNENTENEIYRIISARLAEPEEKNLYEQEKFGSGYFE